MKCQIIVIITVCTAVTVALNTNAKCRAKHQDLIQRSISLKKECGAMEVHDCCPGALMGNLYYGYYQSSIYQIYSSCKSFRNPFQSSRTQLAHCDMKTDLGGWLVIMRRDASVSPRINFNQNWINYESGFGDLETEFWYGLREMHCLTQTDVDMRIDMISNGTKFYWTYSQFKVDGPETNYRLRISGPVGSPGTQSRDAITSHIKSGGTPFTTRDRDNDGNRAANCANLSSYSGGWWYWNCSYAQLTRLQANGEMRWGPRYIPLSFVEMKIRPKNCNINLQACS